LQQHKKNDGVEPQVRVEKDYVNEGENMEHQDCNTIISFTELLTAPLGGVYDGHMF